MFNTETYDDSPVIGNGNTLIKAEDAIALGANCVKLVPYESLVVNDGTRPNNDTESFSISSTKKGAPRNVKLFVKNRSRGTENGALPTIIGGSDLVPHTKRTRADRGGDQGGETREEEEDDDDDYSTFFNAGGEERRSGVTRGTKEGGASLNLNQRPVVVTSGGKRLTIERERRRKADDSAEGIDGTGARRGNDRDDNSRNDEAGKRARPRRTIDSLF